MASKNEIAVRALSKLGQPRVSNIETDSTTNAIVLRDMYDVVRDALVASYPWNFAIKRAQLAKDSISPAWGYNNSFTLPVDFLALLEIKSNPDYRIESGAIVTNASAPLYIKYIRQVTEAGDFNPLFAEAFATKLAYEACDKIVESNTKKQILFQEFKDLIREAYASDAIQDPPELLPDNEWIIARNSGSDEIDYG